MSAAHLAAPDRPRGLGIMLRIAGRIQRRSALTWVLVLGASTIGTTGSALVAINGKVAGIDSLGGVIADGFGFIAAYLLPLPRNPRDITPQLRNCER